MQFEYYEIRPSVEFQDEVRSYTGDGTPEGALVEAEEEAKGRLVLWTLYGRQKDGMAQAIGDFDSFGTAYAVMNAILMPMRQLANSLEDICNQSTTLNRL